MVQNFYGPFPIKRKINAVAFELVLPKSLKVYPVFHVSLLKPTVPNPFPDCVSEIPPPILVEGNEEFEVEAVLDCRLRNNQTQFLVKWKGYGPEPVSNVHAPRLVQAFFQHHPEKRALKGTLRLPTRGRQCKRTALVHTHAYAHAHGQQWTSRELMHTRARAGPRS